MNKIFIWNNSAVTNAIIQKLEKSSSLNEIFYANKRTICLSQNARLLKSDGMQMLREMAETGINYIFSNSEANNKGFINICNKHGFYCIGSRFQDVILENSKVHAKFLMKKYSINTAKYAVVSKKSELKSALKRIGLPCYIKADGTAGSLSAIKVENEKEYFNIAVKYLNGYYGDDSKKILIEEPVQGIEISIPLILDGKTIKIWNILKDYKKKYNGNTGPNTGGMGSYCPYILSAKQMKSVENLIQKLEYMLLKEGCLYKGFMTINVILTDNDIYLLEINTRLGDSEGQTVLKLLNDDLFEIFDLILKGQIENYIPDFKIGFSMSLNIINKTYPEIIISQPQKAYISKTSVQKIIDSGIDVFFYNGTKQSNKNYIQIHNRFLSLCAYHQNLDSLSGLLNNAASSLSSRNVYYRTDLGMEINV